MLRVLRDWGVVLGVGAGVVLSIAVLLTGSPVYAQAYVIDNGLAPPSPENVLLGDPPRPGRYWAVYDFLCNPQLVSCDPTVPPRPTTVEVPNASRIYFISIADTSNLIASGGQVTVVHLHDQASAEVGYSRIDRVQLYDDSTAAIVGGTIDRLSISGTGSQTLVTGGHIFNLLAGGPADSQNSTVIAGGVIESMLQYEGAVRVAGGNIESFTSRAHAETVVEGGFVDSLVGEGLARILVTGGELTLGPSIEGAELELIDGTLHGTVELRDASSILVSGGEVEGGFESLAYSTVEVDGGVVRGDVHAREEAWVVISGGSPGDRLIAHDRAWIRIQGSNFAIDGVPASIGDVMATRGRLTGVLADGSSLDVMFHQGGDVDPAVSCEPCTGFLSLEPVLMDGGTL